MVWFLISGTIMSCAQTSEVEKIKQCVDGAQIEADIRFLAADQLQGRALGSPGLDTAAAYIARQFRQAGVLPFSKASNYFQQVNLYNMQPPTLCEMQVGKQALEYETDLLLADGKNGEISGPVFLLKQDSLQSVTQNLTDKIIISERKPESSDFFSFLKSEKENARLAKENGALAYLSAYPASLIPWTMVINFLDNQKLVVGKEGEDSNSEIPFLLISEIGQRKLFPRLSKVGEATIRIEGFEKKSIPAKNVVGYIEGTDPNLRKEFVALTAHYDHIGIAKNSFGEDSIYNGARDNAVGTAALINAARYFGENPPERSLVLLAVTAEESGMIGSKWFVNHPLVPLKDIVFNLNTDEAGYNDTTLVTAIGLGKTDVRQKIETAARANGLAVNDDPAPEQNLFDRSDNVSFAAKGIPAINLSPGITGFDADIIKYYHKVADEANTLNFSYLERVIETYITVTQAIANTPEKPFWKAGDKYETAGKKLYGM